MARSTRKNSGLFPTTDWIALEGAKAIDANQRRAASQHLAERYWRPVFCYLRSFGHDRYRAEDLTQDFFARLYESDALAKVDSKRGRFRSFLLGSLTNFLRNRHRDERAAKRIPPDLLASLHAVVDGDTAWLEPKDNETPEAAFNRAWSAELVLRVLASLAAELTAKDQTAHLDIFQRFLVEPTLRGTAAPDYATLARDHGIEIEQVGFRLTTARRAFRKLLRAELRTFASSDEEVEAEEAALLAFLSKP